MKRFIILIFFATMSFFGYSQDWFGFNRYQADNERIITSGDWPEVVFMGNSITDNCAYFHPDFFNSNNFCGRGIGGQTSYWVSPERVVDNIIAMCNIAQSNGIVPIISSIPPCSEFPWRKEINNPGQTIVDINKSLKTFADANGIVYVDYHSAFTDEKLGLPKTLSNDGCHPLPDTYFTMEEMVLEAIRNALKK